MNKDEIMDLFLQDVEELQLFFEIKIKYGWGMSRFSFPGSLLITNKKLIIIHYPWFFFPRHIVLPKNKISEIMLKRGWIIIKWIWNKKSGKFKIQVHEKDKIKRRSLNKNIYDNLLETISSQNS